MQLRPFPAPLSGVVPLREVVTLIASVFSQVMNAVDQVPMCWGPKEMVNSGEQWQAHLAQTQATFSKYL